jgi:glycosyltransferase involved in cell wall biosynthesis
VSAAAGRLTVVHVLPSMAVDTGGPPVGCAGLTAALGGRGHRVTLAALETPGRATVPVAAGVTLKTFPADGGGRYQRSRAFAAWCREAVPAADIVHVHGVWLHPTYAAAAACRAAGVPYIVTPHGMLDEYAVRQGSAWLKRGYWWLRERHVVTGAAAIHYLNPAELGKATRGARGRPAFILGNGIPADQLDRLPARGRFRARHPAIGERPTVLFLSRLHPKKGLDRLLPAWAAFVRAVPDGRLVIAGRGEAGYEASLDRLIATLGLGRVVVRVGQLVGAEKWEALVDADLFVLPSHQEGFPMAVVEALAAGCPAVVTSACNVPEVAASGCGVEVAGGDMAAFARAAAALWQDGPRRAVMAAAGRRLVRARYTWESIAADMESVYWFLRKGGRLPPDGRPVWHLGASESGETVRA